MTRTILLSLALVLTVEGVAHAQAPDPKAVNELWPAVGACITFLRTKKVDDSNYYKYLESKKKAEATDPKVLTTDQKVSGRSPKEVLPECDKLVADYEKGIGYENDPVSSACLNTMAKRLDPVLTGAYQEQHKSKGKAMTIWFVRKDVEAARWYMTGKEGFQTGGRICEVPDKFRKGFAELGEKLKKAEAQVAEWEKEKGVVFGGVKNNNAIIYKDAQTGAELPNADKI